MASFASTLRSLPRDRPSLGLAAGAGIFIVASALRWALGGMSEGFGPLMFLPAILLAGLFGGILIGLGVALVCVLVAWVLFFPPYGTFTLAGPHALTMIDFIVTAALELYVIRMLRVAIGDLSEARERSNTLFRELQHRVANNLQLVAALLQLSKRKLTADSAGREALDHALTRLDMMSRVHRRLHDPKAVDQPVEQYFEALGMDLIRASATPDVRLTVKAEPIALEFEALMSVSLIVAELVTNSLKHAFHGRTDGAIAIRFERNRGVYTVAVSDDGPGLPEKMKPRSDRLGQSILRSLASQLHGKIVFEPGPGAVARLVFQP